MTVILLRRIQIYMSTLLTIIYVTVCVIKYRTSTHGYHSINVYDKVWQTL